MKTIFPPLGHHRILTCFICLLFAVAGCKEKEGTSSPELPPVVAKSGGGSEVTPSQAAKGGREVQPEDEAEDDFPDNIPPEIDSLTFSPEAVFPGTQVTAEASGSDADNDEVSFFYRWMINDAFIPDEEGEGLDTKGLKKGDRVAVFVTPFDGYDKGKEKGFSFVIMNSTPEITSSFPLSGFSGETIIYDVKAADPDGDELTFALDPGGAPGMEIDATTGRLSWDLPDEGLTEKVQIKIRVTDGDASAIQEVNITPP